MSFISYLSGDVEHMIAYLNLEFRGNLHKRSKFESFGNH